MTESKPATLASDAITMPYIPVPWGDVLDKMAILEIKNQRITNEQSLANVRRELDVLGDIVTSQLVLTEEIRLLCNRLHDVNARLWNIEDAIRVKDRERDFGQDFVELSKAVYQTNDQRAGIKKAINIATSSTLVEEKSYTS